MGWEIILVVLAIVLLIVISNIFVVQQSRAYVIERLGAFHAVQGEGLGLSNLTHMLLLPDTYQKLDWHQGILTE